MLSDFAPRDSSEIILPPLKHKTGYGLEVTQNNYYCIDIARADPQTVLQLGDTGSRGTR